MSSWRVGKDCDARLIFRSVCARETDGRKLDVNSIAEYGRGLGRRPGVEGGLEDVEERLEIEEVLRLELLVMRFTEACGCSTRTMETTRSGGLERRGMRRICRLVPAPTCLAPSHSRLLLGPPLPTAMAVEGSSSILES